MRTYARRRCLSFSSALLVSCAIVFSALTISVLAQSSGGTFVMTQSVVSNGGNTSTGSGPLSLTGTAGQAGAGALLSNSPFFELGGFWPDFITGYDLTITKSHSGNFIQGQSGAQYTITVNNVGPGPTSGTVTVVDVLPSGLTATALSGSGWVCNVGTLTCMRADPLPSFASYLPIILTVSVACNAPANVNNATQVSGANDINTGNNLASDPTIIVPDTTPPTITCPGGITKFTDSGQTSATVNPGTPVALDNCGIPTVTGVRSDGKPLNAPYPAGVTIITWTAKDAGNNTASCAQSIAVMVPSGQRRKP